MQVVIGVSSRTEDFLDKTIEATAKFLFLTHIYKDSQSEILSTLIISSA